jgi:ATP-dependent Clp protease protease subunit
MATTKDIENNTIFFNDDINTISITKLINSLLVMETYINNKYSETLTAIDTLQILNKSLLTITVNKPPILLYITSNGGDITQAILAADYIMHMDVHVHTICIGYVASAGTIISLSGTKRFITKNTFMLIHELSTSIWGKYSILSERMSNLSKMMKIIKKYYVKHTKMTLIQLTEYLKHDIYWNAKKCLKHGLVDAII